MSRPLRVLVVCGHGVLGGAESWLLQLLDATDRLDVSALTLADGELVAAFRDRGLPVTVLPTGYRPSDLAGPGLRLRAVLAAEPWDVVVANGVKAAILVLPVAAALGVPAVWVRHDHTFGARAAGPLGRLARRVVVTERQLIADTGRDECVVIEPPAPPAALPRAAARKALGLQGARPVLAVVGRLVDYKGFDDAVAALSLPDGSDWDLLVIGEDDPAAPGENARLRGLVADLDLEARVTLAGRVADAGRLLSGVDALAVLTKQGSGRSPSTEGFGMTALEAARAGVPVIAIEGSPPAERLTPHAGIAVGPGDPAAVARALKALSVKSYRRRLGSAGAAASADHPDAATAADRLATTLADAARRPGAGLEGPPVSVVVTVWNEADAVGGLLRRLLPQLRAEDELVVVDGGSTDGTVERLRQAAGFESRLTVIVEDGAGISEGRNIGIRNARWPVIACTDAGCEPVPEWLAELSAAFAETDPADLVTGVYAVSSARRTWWSDALAAVGYPEPRDARRSTPLVRGYGALMGRMFDPTLPTGRSMAFTRSAWSAAGGFPEHLATGEDITYGKQLVAAGGRAVLGTGAEVEWEQRPTLAANLQMYRGYGRGDGQVGSMLLVGRNVARAVAYPVGLLLLARGGRVGRGSALLGGLGYLSLPLAHAVRRNPRSLPALPLMAAARDGAKVLGCLEGLRTR